MKNKICLASVLCFLFLLDLPAQDKKETPLNLSKKKFFFEGGANIYQLDFIGYQYPYISDYYAPKLQNSFFRGVNFKYYFGKNVLRTSIDYVQKSGNSYSRTYYTSEQLSKTGSLSLGFERLLLKGRFSPYVFTDLTSAYGEYKGNYNFDCWMGFAPDFNGEYFIKSTMLGVAQGFGLRFNPAKSFVINIETSAEYYTIRQKDLKNKSLGYYGNDLKLNPLRVSLGFIF